MKTHVVVGLDMSTEEENQGVAVGKIRPGRRRIELVKIGNGRILNQTLDDYKQSPTLLAIDSPLGWPLSMRAALRGHLVGREIPEARETVFYRKTDEFVKDKFVRLVPLRVGADKLGATAHAACELLGERNISVLLESGIPKRLSAIEVYPAATLRAYGWEGITFAQGTPKKQKEQIRRQEKFDFLKGQGVAFHDMEEKNPQQ